MGENILKFQVALGYRDAVKGPWKRKAAGNVTRILACKNSEATRVSLQVILAIQDASSTHVFVHCAISCWPE